MEPEATRPERSRLPWLLGALAVLAALFYSFCGLYSIQPIGALPEGATAIVWRESAEPFFNSADALCLERTADVSLLCRGLAMTQAPTDRIILRIGYQDWAYRQSVGGRSFER